MNNIKTNDVIILLAIKILHEPTNIMWWTRIAEVQRHRLPVTSWVKKKCILVAVLRKIGYGMSVRRPPTVKNLIAACALCSLLLLLIQLRLIAFAIDTGGSRVVQ